MKRILYVEHNTDGTVGGSHVCLLEICRSLDRARFQPVVCFFQRHSLVPAFEQTGADILFHTPPTPTRIDHFGLAGRLLQSGLNFLRTFGPRMLRWRRLLRQQRIDLVHLNNACGFDHDLMLAALLSRIPCVVHERGIQRSLSRATRFFANRVARIITISQAVDDNLSGKGVRPEKLLRIDDGIDPQRLMQQRPVNELRSQWGIPTTAPVIGIVGNVKRWKGQETVVRAMQHLKPRFPALRCLLVGSTADEHYKAHLDGLVRDLGLDGMVIFAGYQKQPTDLMGMFDVVVHASIDPEPFGIVVLEAMGKQKPVVATNIGGPREIVIDGETGFLTPPGDDRALAERLALLLSDAALCQQMGAAGQSRLHERYTARQNVDRIQNLYAQLLRD